MFKTFFFLGMHSKLYRIIKEVGTDIIWHTVLIYIHFIHRDA